MPSQIMLASSRKLTPHRSRQWRPVKQKWLKVRTRNQTIKGHRRLPSKCACLRTQCLAIRTAPRNRRKNKKLKNRNDSRSSSRNRRSKHASEKLSRNVSRRSKKGFERSKRQNRRSFDNFNNLESNRKPRKQQKKRLLQLVVKCRSHTNNHKVLKCSPNTTPLHKEWACKRAMARAKYRARMARLATWILLQRCPRAKTWISMDYTTWKSMARDCKEMILSSSWDSSNNPSKQRPSSSRLSTIMNSKTNVKT